MQPEYESHNFAENNEPRSYEAAYLLEDKVIVKALIYQSERRVNGGKPLLRWRAMAVAWTPGQGKDDHMQLCHLEAHEMAVRAVLPHEATLDDWLLAARADAELLMERAQIFARVIASAAEGKRKVGR
jgi:hypothetical protein